MNNYVILTDSACDMTPAMMASLGIKYLSLTFTFTDEDRIYENYELNAKDFYNEMRNGRTAKTSAVNVADFTDFFENELKAGNDILYLGFSSGLSTTYNSACVAAEDLREAYPDRKIICIDTLAASAGMGLLVYLTAMEKEKGAALDEAAAFAAENRLHLSHWFTVDSLEYLKRGGRVSATKALVGGLLGIKPILHVDNDGHLINMFTVRGRRKSFAALTEKIVETGNDKKAPVWISHGDCEEDALEVAKLISESFGVEVSNIVNVGPVIGAHSGPGTIALFFLASER